MKRHKMACKQTTLSNGASEFIQLTTILYIMLGISALHINVRNLIPPPPLWSDHQGDGAVNYFHTVIK